MVPKLRFPEFREAGEWGGKALVDFATIVRGGSPRPIDEYITNDADGLNWLKIGDIDKESKFVTSTQEKVVPAALAKTRVVNPGDLILSNSMSFGRPYILEIKTCIHDGWIAVSEIDNSLDRDYLYYLMMTSASQMYFSNNAAGSGVQNLNADIIKLLPVSYPSKNEQQKIADCLSSIDELLTLAAQKLVALKAHKKGLMQQLFPAEGETLPKLRFPEFNSSPEWKENDLINLSECGLSNGVFNDPKKVGSGYKLVNVLDMYIDTVINEDKLSLVELSRDEFLKNKVENGDIFFTRSSLVKSGIAYSNIYLGNSNDITFDGHLIRFRPNKNILIPIFANYLLRTNRIRSQLVARGKTATMTTIGQADVKSVKVAIPHTNEQQKIADCLSSIDELVAAQTQKLDTLKAHKKGLMQQLFPTLDEAKS